MDTVGRERMGQMEKVEPLYIYTLSCVRWMAAEKLLCRTGTPVWCSGNDTEGYEEEGREGKKGGIVYIIMADSCCSMAENQHNIVKNF